MLEFNGASNTEIFRGDTKGLSDVQSYGEKGIEEAKAFWNDIFRLSANEEKNVIDFESVFSEIFGRDENEFVFELDDKDMQTRSIISEYKGEVWQTFSDEEKCERIRQFIDVLADKLELKVTPQLLLFDGPEDNCGAFNPVENVIKINHFLLDNPKELLNTVAHEMRHAYQHVRAEIGETFMDLLYAMNFENYISPVPLGEGKFLFFLDYEDQLVEAEARAFAKMFE